MEPDLLSKDLSACPRCGAGVRADAPWCTQCFLSLRTPAPPAAPVVPAQAAAPAPAPLPPGLDPLTAPLHALPGAHAVPAALPPGIDPLTSPLHAVVGDPLAPAAPTAPTATATAAPSADRTWPCTACQTPNSFELDACASCGQGFLAGLAGVGTSLVLPGVGDLAAMSKGKRMGMAIGAAVALMLLVLAVGLLLG